LLACEPGQVPASCLKLVQILTQTPATCSIVVRASISGFYNTLQRLCQEGPRRDDYNTPTVMPDKVFMTKNSLTSGLFYRINYGNAY
jgi:hypothetical protein